MATITFTSWVDLYKALKDTLAQFISTGKWQAVSYSIGDRNLSFRTVDDLQKVISFVKLQADLEQGNIIGRTYARPARSDDDQQN
jgi:hypothetical protein